MASHLDRWEKDPFFPAAEEVQESADRMESTYRTLIHASKEPSDWNSEALRRDLQTALGTTKWQLEEFERAVVCSYGNGSTDDTKDRHRDFINAMESQISRVESSWNDSAASTGKPPRPWVLLDEGERKELELFLSGSATPCDEKPAKAQSNDGQMGSRKQKSLEQLTSECSKKLSLSVQRGQVEAKEDKFSGHRRAASASAEIASWNITVADDGSRCRKMEQPPRKIPSFSGLLNTLESASKLKWSKNGYRKLKHTDQHQDADAKSSETRPLTRGIKASHGRSKSCPEHCDDHYDKRLHGWYGAIQRQFQRSQYYMLYSRRTRMIFWGFVGICFLALVVIHWRY